MDTVHELEARRDDAMNNENGPMPKFNRFFAKSSAARDLSVADAAGHAQVEAEEAAKIDSFGHPISNTMESTADHMYQEEMMKKSAAEAEAADTSGHDQQQKGCLAECLGRFHGSLRTCAKKCK